MPTASAITVSRLLMFHLFSGKNGRYMFSLGIPLEDKTEEVQCLENRAKIDEFKSLSEGQWGAFTACPCTRKQALIDPLFTFQPNVMCGQYRFPVCSVNIQCCYYS